MTVQRRIAERLLALSLAIPIVVALWLGPISAYVGLVSSGSEQIARRQQLLERYRMLTAEAPSATTGAADPKSANLLAPGLPEAQAVARLQQAVKQAAEANQVEIRTFQVLPGGTLSGARRTAVRIAAAGEMAGIGKLLFAIEAARPVLYPDNLKIQARPTMPGSKRSEILDFQLDISSVSPGVSG
ncbi:MAG TPA: type II secretion system protein GspM [Stellaceae bacterium]|nr:type II secretion system protein GspM [Stellaceae bacterium]